MAKPKKRSKAKPAVNWSPAIDAPTIAQFQQSLAQVEQAVASIRAALPYLLSLTPEQRQRSAGRFHQGEDKAIGAVLDFADAWPQHFTVLADKDFGSDAAKFEVQVLRDRTTRRAGLATLGEELAGLAQSMQDTVLALGEVVREPALAAYKIARVLAASNAAMAAVLAPARTFYGGPAKKAVKTKAKRGAAAKS